MRNEDTNEIAAFNIVTGVYMDMASRQSCPIPLDIRESIENLRVDQHKLYWEETLTPDLSVSAVG